MVTSVKGHLQAQTLYFMSKLRVSGLPRMLRIINAQVNDATGCSAWWLPWLHGYLVLEAYCIRQAVSMLFPPPFLCNKEKRNKLPL